MEAGERLLAAELGRDNDVSLEDDLLRQAHGTKLCGTSVRDAGVVCGVEPDDAAGDAG